jgi:hypothetical protein
MADTTKIAAKAAPKKKKAKRTVVAGQVHVSATFNNTIITFTDPQGGAVVPKKVLPTPLKLRLSELAKPPSSNTALVRQRSSSKALALAVMPLFGL